MLSRMCRMGMLLVVVAGQAHAGHDNAGYENAGYDNAAHGGASATSYFI